ncbi:MAG: hypothetical protein ACRD1F_12560, partial [Terriglobales bacterium]
MALALTLAIGATAQAPALGVPSVFSLPGPSRFAPTGGVAVDGGANVYFSGVTGTSGQFLWAYNRATGQVTSVAPNSSIASAQALAVDHQGNLYVADASANKIWKVTPAGTVSALAATSSAPIALAVDGSGNLYYATSSEVFRIAGVNGVPG